MSGAQLTIDPELFRPLIAEVVREVLAQLEADKQILGDRLAIGEPEAARLLDMKPHQLRDARLEGQIIASRTTNRRVVYERRELLDFLQRRRTHVNGNGGPA